MRGALVMAAVLAATYVRAQCEQFHDPLTRKHCEALLVEHSLEVRAILTEPRLQKRGTSPAAA